MRLALTTEQEALRKELRAYFAGLLDEIGVDYKGCIRRMGEDGWLGIGWPKEYGGQARPLADQLIFVEESHWAGVPLPLLTLNSVGPTLMALGTDEQKRDLLPRILRIREARWECGGGDRAPGDVGVDHERQDRVVQRRARDLDLSAFE